MSRAIFLTSVDVDPRSDGLLFRGLADQECDGLVGLQHRTEGSSDWQLTSTSSVESGRWTLSGVRRTDGIDRVVLLDGGLPVAHSQEVVWNIHGGLDFGRSESPAWDPPDLSAHPRDE